MRTRDHFVNVRPFFGLALLVTAAVVGLPFLLVLAWVSFGSPSAIGLVVAALVTMSVVFAAGSALWKNRPESADISFGELMIWGWLLRKRADDRLHEGARLLGLDRSGQPEQPVLITPERQIAVLHELNAALESKDPYTHGHSQRVERHVYRTAAAMGLATSAIEELRFAAAIHDVGKIRVPDRVLRKPSSLTPTERTIVEEHVVVGAWMVSNVASADVVSAVRHHHERWDGRGYPDGLAGTDIPLYARIVAVADAYDAITSTRPYRVSSGREHAVEVLRAEAGTQFDPMIVNAFVEALPVRLPVAGMLVFLAAPQALVRRLAVWLKRLGAQHLAPTAATLGAVVTLGAFLPLPATPPPSPAPAIAAPAAEDEGTEVTSRPDKRSRSEAVRLAVTTTIADTAGPARENDVVLADTLVRDGTPDVAEPKPDPRPDPKPEPKPDAPEPAAEPDPEPRQESEEESRNPNDGKDGCRKDGNAGEGNDAGCGQPRPSDDAEDEDDD
ncbi:MAG: HD-GYP domain-containing protein [Actinomycetota bacterium]|nr:HD-GYP domain-containing protein [Actinomycetota bacterium]